MYIILGTILGALVGYLLTTSKELKAYRRDRLEKCALAFNEHAKTVYRLNKILIAAIQQDTFQVEKIDFYNEIHKIENQVHDCDVLISLHGRSLMGKAGNYTEDVLAWMDIFSNAPEDLEKPLEYVDQIDELYDKTTTSMEELLSAISDEIYRDSYYAKFTNYIKTKWQWFKSLRKGK